MGLRVLLVGLVASLGLDLPTGQDLEKMARSGQAWVCAGLDEWTAWPASPGTDEGLVEASGGEATGPELASIAEDDGAIEPEAARPEQVIDGDEFEAIVEEMSADFEAAEFVHVVEEMVAEFAVDEVSGPRGATSAPSFEPQEVADDLDVGLAYELNRLGEGVFDGAPAREATAAATPRPDPARDDVALSSRGQRLATAVKLTGEALTAWATLIQGPAVVSLRP